MGYILTIIARFAENTVLGSAGQISYSIAGIHFFGIPVLASVAAYTLAICLHLGLGQGTSLLLSLIAALGALGMFLIAYRKLETDTFAVFSLASILATDAVIRSWESVTGGALGISGITRPAFITSLDSLVVFECIIMVILLAIQFLILLSRVGLYIRGLRENKLLLSSLGVNPVSVGSIAITASSILGAIAGIVTLYRIQFIDPSFGGIPWLLTMLTVAIIAVRPKVSSLILASLAITLLPEGIRMLSLPSSILGHVRTAIYAIIVIIAARSLARYLPVVERTI